MKGIEMNDLTLKNASLEVALTRLASNLNKAELPLHDRANQGSQSILRLLRKNGQDVDRAVVVGSLINSLQQRRDNTSTLNKLPHFDVVVFINNREPPFQSTLREFAEIFSKSGNIEIVNTEHSQFIGVVHGECRYDIFPATNCIVGQDKVKKIGQQQQCQYQRTVEKIIRCESPAQGGRMYSSALAESALEFTKNQSESEIVNSVITLAKHWLSQVNTENYCLLRRSYLLECIAIYASATIIDNNNNNEDKVSKAFKKFLELVTSFHTLSVNLRKVQIPDYYQTRRYVGPVVIDPVNPHNNLALLQSDPMKQEEIIQIFETAAMISLWKLDRIQSQNIPIKSISDISGIFLQLGNSESQVDAGSSSPSLASGSRRKRVSCLGLLFFVPLLIIFIVVKAVRFTYRKFGWYPFGVSVFFLIYFASHYYRSV